MLSELDQQKCKDEMLYAKNKKGQTPLHLACVANKEECVAALIAAGSEFSTADQWSIAQTAIAHASTACVREVFTAFPDQLNAKVTSCQTCFIFS